jgi:epoxyqueuosine reductase
MASELRAQLDALAPQRGFARLGVARAEALIEDAARLRAWLAGERHGTMEYMARTEAVRADPRHPGMLPEARSVVVLVTPYARAEPPAGIGAGRVARYAQGRDYHNVLHTRLKPLTRLLRDAGHAARASVDTMPVLERAWAQRAGVGFIGKNCCLIVPGLGSHVFVSAIVTSAELEPDAPMAQRCGECTLCLDACPTRAFEAPRVLDARRCISYLTIEHRGAIAESLRAQVGDWIFGCDVCQDVCPFNRTAPASPETTAAFAAHPRFADVSPEALLTMDEDGHRAFAQGSPLRRAGCEGLARNAALVLANTGNRRALPVLQRAAAEHPSEVVRDAAGWAVERLGE